MSAFIVEDKTINGIVAWLRREIHQMYRAQEQLNALGFDTNAGTWEEQLAHRMFALNVVAVNARYGAGEAEKFRPLDFRYSFIGRPSKVQVFKSMRCWLYQCTEGDVPEDPLYKLFANDIERYLMYSIINEIPEYDAAEWG